MHGARRPSRNDWQIIYFMFLQQLRLTQPQMNGLKFVMNHNTITFIFQKELGFLMDRFLSFCIDVFHPEERRLQTQ